jgi:hypothetical protein
MNRLVTLANSNHAAIARLAPPRSSPTPASRPPNPRKPPSSNNSPNRQPRPPHPPTTSPPHAQGLQSLGLRPATSSPPSPSAPPHCSPFSGASPPTTRPTQSHQLMPMSTTAND